MKKKDKKGTPGQTGQLVVNKIVIKQGNRSILDIENWRSAMKAADRGKRVQLYDLYEDILLDNVLSDAIDKRVTAITDANICFTRNDKPVPEMDDLVDSPGFEELVTELMLAKFWGKTVVEFDFTAGMEVYNIPRKHLRPKTGTIVIDQSDETGVPYRGDDRFMEAGKDDDLGLILKACPYVIYKRGGFGDWNQFAELFGMPFRKATYNAYDDATRVALEQAMERAGSAAYAVIPKEGDIEYIANSTTGDGELYDKLRKACNEEMLYGILGQTMTTMQGSSRSQGEVHLEVQEKKHKADRRYIQRLLNRRLLPILEARGYPVAGGFFSFPEEGEHVSMKERVEIDARLAGMIPVGVDYFYETYGIPKPKPGDEIAGQREGLEEKEEGEEKNAEKGDGKGKEKEKTGKEKGLSGENEFWRWLHDFFVLAPGKGAGWNGDHLTGEGKESDGEDFTTRLLGRVNGKTTFDGELFTFFAGEFKRRLNAGFDRAKKARLADVEITYGAFNPVVQTAMETNVFHFSAAKTLAELQRLNEIYRESTSFKDFLKKARRECEVFNVKWAETEWNTATLAAESAGTYYRLLGRVKLYPCWKYVTVDDDKVRPEHVKLHGVILPANDPRWKKIFPPNDWNCRCYVVPLTRSEVENVDIEANRALVDEYFKTPEFKSADAQGWGVNRAELQQVFTEDQFYIKKFPGKASKTLEELGPADFGLDSTGKRAKTTSGKMPGYEGTPGEWFEANRTGNDVVLPDYNSRPVTVTARSFKTHTTGTRAGRVRYLEGMKRTLADPDEVWINNERGKDEFNNYTLIKYYDGEVLVVCCRVENGKVNEVKTWFPMAMKKKVQEAHRRGLLVYEKKDSR